MKPVIYYISDTMRSLSPHAQPVVMALFAITLLLAFLSGEMAFLVLLVLAVAIAVYADPPRVIPDGAGLVLAPLDGYISDVVDHQGLPLAFELNKAQTEDFRRVSLRGACRGCRVLRAPVTGTVREILRDSPGTTMARDATSGMPWSHMDAVSILMADDDGQEYALVIRGVLVPHQIVLSVQVGDRVQAGDRMGLARFFVTMDLYMPITAPLLRVPEQRVMAGETVLMAASFQHTPHFKTV